MIFSTQHQLITTLIFVFCGILSGLILSTLNILFCINFYKKLLKNIINCILSLFFCIIFTYFLNFFNFGKFSLVLVFAYIFGFWLIKNLLKQLVVILENLWYNKIKKIFKFKRKSNKHRGQNKEYEISIQS